MKYDKNDKQSYRRIANVHEKQMKHSKKKEKTNK